MASSSRKSDTEAETVALVSNDEASSTSFELANSCAGLDNLANTCYMNSSIVCLASVPKLRDYFLSDEYKDSLEVNGMRTEGTKGEFAKEFHLLLSKLWSNSFKSYRESYPPRKFKEKVGQVAKQFAGCDQHDAMEFLEFTIDTLREDCNRVKGKKPYEERKEDPAMSDLAVARHEINYHLTRNDSYIDDLFVGYCKRTSTCPDKKCLRESYIFDPVLSIKLPLTSSCDSGYDRRFEVSVVALEKRRVARHIVTLDRRGFVSSLKYKASNKAGLEISQCMLVDVSRNVLSCLQDSAPLGTIRAADKLVLYEFTAKDAKVISRLDPRAFVEHVQIRDTVVVFQGLLSANVRDALDVRQLDVGMRGCVLGVDSADGALCIHFEGVEESQWVERHKCHCLLKLNGDQKKICPQRQKAYPFREVLKFKELGNSFRRCRDYWLHEMENVDASRIPCIIFFRKVLTDTNGASNSSIMRRCGFCASRAGRQPELVGIPLLLCVHRDTTAANMHKVVSSELLHRFGIDCNDGGLVLYHAESAKDALRSNLIVPSEESVLPLGTALQPDDRELVHFVVQLGPVYAEVCQDFEEIARVKLKENVIPIQTCFQFLVGDEQLHGDNQVTCSGCNKKQNMLTKTEIWSLPQILVVHLKRFEYDAAYDYYRKCDKGVSFPLEGLDLRDYERATTSFPAGFCVRAGTEVEIVGLESDAGKLLNGQRGTVQFLDTASKRFCVRLKNHNLETLKKVQPKNLKPVPPERSNTEECPPWIYDLVSLAKHIGRPGFGHYVAYARSSEDGLWRLYDDDDVREVRPEIVEAEHSGCYVLIYMRRDLRPPAWGHAKKY